MNETLYKTFEELKRTEEKLPEGEMFYRTYSSGRKMYVLLTLK